MVVILVIGIVVGLAIMSQPNDLGCLGGWLFILLVVVLCVVILTGAN